MAEIVQGFQPNELTDMAAELSPFAKEVFDVVEKFEIESSGIPGVEETFDPVLAGDAIEPVAAP